MRRQVSLAIVVLAVFAASARGGVPEPGFTDTQYVGGFSQPTAIAFLPDGTLLITEKGGNLNLFDGSSTTTLVTIPVCNSSEMGLLGVAPDPDFTTNGFIYLYRTKAGAGGCGTATGRFNQVVRVTMSAGSVSLGSLVELLDGMRTDNGNHDGGVLRIGPDGKLFVGVGDTGNGDNQGPPGSSTNPYSQDLNALEGKILRLNLDGTPPSDNPFVGMAGVREEIWAYGFRNPFRMNFDDATGKLWIADVGDETIEEVDIGSAGGNYSWPRCEGNLQGPPASPQPCVVGTDIAPIFTYPHSGGSSLGTCIIGGDFAGSAFGGMAGDYVFGDCVRSAVYHVALNAMRDGFASTPSLISSSAGTPSDFVTGPDGAIYYVANTGGDVRRLAGAPSGIDALLVGKALTLRDNPANAARKSVATVSRDAGIDLGGGVGSLDDPTIHGGSLRIVSTAGGFDDTYPMPSTFWSYIGKPADGKGYKYKDTQQVSGPIKAATVRNGKMLRVTGRGMGLSHTLASNPDPVSAVLQTGTKHYCMTVGTSTGARTTFKANKVFTAKNASTPGACPP
jgi:glucose/arabinose dehydrogenase